MEPGNETEQNQNNKNNEILSYNQVTDYPPVKKFNVVLWILITVLIITLVAGAIYFVLDTDNGASEQQITNTSQFSNSGPNQEKITSEETDTVGVNNDIEQSNLPEAQTKPLEFADDVEVMTYDDPDDVSSVSLYSLREFVNRVYSLTVDAAPTEAVRTLAGDICNHEYLQPTVDRYKHELTCVQDSDAVRFSAPYMFGVTAYCTDSSGFSGLVISSNEKAEVLCEDAFELMRPFDANNPDLARINSFLFPEFSRTFSVYELNQEGYEKLKQYYGKYYGEGSYVNTKYGYSFDFPSAYAVSVESGDTQNINEAKWVELTGGDAGPTYAQISIRVLEEDSEWVGDSIKWENSNGESGEIPLTQIQRDNDYVLVSEATSRLHNDQSDNLRAVSMRTSYVLWSEDGESSPLVITIQTMHSSEYDEVNFAYNYKYHEFLEDVIVETLRVDKEVIKSNQNN
jgi:hypothetical protein